MKLTQDDLKMMSLPRYFLLPWQQAIAIPVEEKRGYKVRGDLYLSGDAKLCKVVLKGDNDANGKT
jgi:hypothetical protein